MAARQGGGEGGNMKSVRPKLGEAIAALHRFGRKRNADSALHTRRVLTCSISSGSIRSSIVDAEMDLSARAKEQTRQA